MSRIFLQEPPRKGKPERFDPTSSPVTIIHRSAKLATRAASLRYGGRHHSGIPGGIIPLYPGGFVGIGRLGDDEIFACVCSQRAELHLEVTAAAALIRALRRARTAVRRLPSVDALRADVLSDRQ